MCDLCDTHVIMFCEVHFFNTSDHHQHLLHSLFGFIVVIFHSRTAFNSNFSADSCVVIYLQFLVSQSFHKNTKLLGL